MLCNIRYKTMLKFYCKKIQIIIYKALNHASRGIIIYIKIKYK